MYIYCFLPKKKNSRQKKRIWKDMQLHLTIKDNIYFYIVKSYLTLNVKIKKKHKIVCSTTSTTRHENTKIIFSMRILKIYLMAQNFIYT